VEIEDQSEPVILELINNKYTCKCGYTTVRKGAATKHLKQFHGKEDKYKCDICDLSYQEERYLLKHKKTHLNNKGIYKCNVCNFTINTKFGLNKHLNTHNSSSYKYTCEYCVYKTNGKANMNLHKNSLHFNIFKFKCDKCEYKTTAKGKLATHISKKHRIHQDSKTFILNRMKSQLLSYEAKNRGIVLNRAEEAEKLIALLIEKDDSTILLEDLLQPLPSLEEILLFCC